MLRAITETAKDERRDRLLACALDEFFEKGFTAARMEDVARRAGLSKGTLYLYFESKEDLFQALIESMTTPKLDHLVILLDEAPCLFSGLDGLATFATSVVQYSEMPKLLKILIGESGHYPDMVRSYRKNVVEVILSVFSDALTRAQSRGEIRIGDPMLTARLIIAPIIMSGIWQALFGHDPDAEVDVEALINLHVVHMKKALSVTEAVA
jgi:AcrR family transcriptional regulator